MVVSRCLTLARLKKSVVRVIDKKNVRQGR